MEGTGEEEFEPVVMQQEVTFYLQAGVDLSTGVDTRGEPRWVLEPKQPDETADDPTDWRQRYVFVCGEVMPENCDMSLVDEIGTVRVKGIRMRQTDPFTSGGKVDQYLKHAQFELFTPANPTGVVVADIEGDATLGSHAATFNITQEDVTRLIMKDDTYSIRLRADVDPVETEDRWVYTFTVFMDIEVELK